MYHVKVPDFYFRLSVPDFSRIHPSVFFPPALWQGLIKASVPKVPAACKAVEGFYCIITVQLEFRNSNLTES